MKIDAFCTRCQKDLPQEAALDRNGELVFTCACGNFIKVPALAPAALKAFLDDHKAQNVGRKMAAPAPVVDSTGYLKSLSDAGLATTITSADVGPVPPGVV